MRLRPLAVLLVLLLTALAATGCAAAEQTSGSVPSSARLAPADAVAFVTLVTDTSSQQWRNADRLLGLFPDAKSSLVDAIRRELAQEDMTWADDVAPALGDELVVVVTAGRKPVVLLQPRSGKALGDLVARSDEPVVRTTVSGWTALAETRADLAAYEAALARGTLETVGSFTGAMEGLPPAALVRGWVDLEVLLRELSTTLEQSGVKDDLGIDWLAAAVSAENDGVLVSVGVRTPGENGTSYEPKLLERVPADAVAAISFGGTQGLLDRVQGAVDVGRISSVLEDAVGVSLDGLVDALSGEGMLYVREGGENVPDVTLVLAPPDVGKAFETVDRVARRLAEQSGRRVETRTNGGASVSELQLEGVVVTYARVDEAVIVTTGPTGIADFLGGGPKLADDPSFTAAAERVGLGDRTRGFAYVDIDGLVPLVERLGPADGLPTEAREALDSLDSVILEGSGEGATTQLDGFLQVTR
jgi:hypothetical protein